MNHNDKNNHRPHHIYDARWYFVTGRTYGGKHYFSTHDRKILPTGEGGFCLTNNQRYYKTMQGYIKFGNMNGVDFGLNFKLGSMQAGLGINRINFINSKISPTAC